jgi:hypothetical protein
MAETTPGIDPLDAFADDWDELTTALNRWGVLHVAPGALQSHGLPPSASELFARLWQATDPRLQQAGVVLLLTHPGLASDARSAIDELDGVTRERAKRRYVAAAALQRMAKTRIAMRLGLKALIPEAYLDDFDLPPLDGEFGRETLLALAEQEQGRFGYDAWGTYRALLDHFLNEIQRRDWGVVCESAPTGSA